MHVNVTDLPLTTFSKKKKKKELSVKPKQGRKDTHLSYVCHFIVTTSRKDVSYEVSPFVNSLIKSG